MCALTLTVGTRVADLLKKQSPKNARWWWRIGKNRFLSARRHLTTRDPTSRRRYTPKHCRYSVTAWFRIQSPRKKGVEAHTIILSHVRPKPARSKSDFINSPEEMAGRFRKQDSSPKCRRKSAKQVISLVLLEPSPCFCISQHKLAERGQGLIPSRLAPSLLSGTRSPVPADFGRQLQSNP